MDFPFDNEFSALKSMETREVHALNTINILTQRYMCTIELTCGKRRNTITIFYYTTQQ